MTLGYRIKEQRLKHGLTQTELAKKINVSAQVISNWERGYTTPNYRYLMKLSNALRVTLEFMLSGTFHVDDVDMEEWMKFGDELKEKGYSLKEVREIIEKSLN